ncbi:unnamed protein product [Camellia sinensis]
MANKDLNEIGLPNQSPTSSQHDVLSLTEFELMELLDVGFAEVTTAVAQVNEIANSLSLLEQCTQNEYFSGHLPTCLKGLDEVLCDGIPFDVLTELVGPAGIGKTQRMIEIGLSSFPDIFHMEGMAQEMASRILVLQPSSLAEFTERLQQIKVSLLQHQVKLLIIDSMTALVSGSLAEFSRIPIVVTNQVRSQSSDEISQYAFQVRSKDDTIVESTRFDYHLVPALGIHWSHAITIRLVLEAISGW